MSAKKLIFIVIAAALAALAAASVRADELSDLRNRSGELSERRETARDMLADIKAEKSAFTQEVVRLDAELEEAQETLDFVSEELEKTENRLAEAEENLAKTAVLRERQYDTLKKRLRYMYESGGSGYIDVMFEATSMSDMMNRFEYVGRVIKFDSGIFDRLIESEKSMEVSVLEIETKKKEEEILKRKREEEALALEIKIENRNDRVAELSEDETMYEQNIKELEAASEEVERLIKEAAERAERIAREKAAEEARLAAEREIRASAGAAPSGSGVFGWPVDGYYSVSSGYVGRISPITGNYEFHTGVDIPAPMGTDVRASAAGVVIVSKYMGGYGNAVVIDHGDSISTLYGHNSKLTVSVGDYVESGDVIAKIGSTGASTGPHCHFEVRVNGGHVNPWSYLN